MYYLGIGFNSAPAHSFIVISCSTGVAVVEEGGIALHEGDGELLEEVGDSDGLVFPSVSGKCAAQLLDFIDGRLVPPAKALHCKRQEDDTLVMAGLPRFVQLALMGNLEGMAGSVCRGFDKK